MWDGVSGMARGCTCALMAASLRSLLRAVAIRLAALAAFLLDGGSTVDVCAERKSIAAAAERESSAQREQLTEHHAGEQLSEVGVLCFLKK